MPVYTARYQGSGAGLPQEDAWKARLRLDKDGEFIQFGCVAISGLGLIRADVARPPSEAFLSNLARRSIVRFRDAIETGVIPTQWPSDAYEVRLDDVGTVKACEADPTPPLTDDEVAWSFEA
jgi:hypothetical protein